MQHRSIATIAREIQSDWGDRVWFGARPYLRAMLSIDRIDERYGEDSAKSVVLYFLANAGQWRGEKARAIKKELKQICGIK